MLEIRCNCSRLRARFVAENSKGIPAKPLLPTRCMLATGVPGCLWLEICQNPNKGTPNYLAGRGGSPAIGRAT